MQLTIKKHPNIVYVFADQMGAHTTGYAGDPNVRTPYLDALAAESVNVHNAISNCPICTPYRACLMSGQYPLTHGLFMNDLCLPDNGHSIAQELGRSGYDTAYIGKWHLDGHGRDKPIPRERRHGFDYWKVLECTHDYNESLYYEGDDETPKKWDGYDAYAQTADAVHWLDNRDDAESPFALFLSFGPPHDPYDSAPDELKALYPPKSLTLRDNVPKARRAYAQQQLTGYYAHVTALDQCVGKIDSALARNGLQEDTIFVFTADHGDLLESHWHFDDGRRGSRKQMPYDESVRVPFLLRYPARYGREERVLNTPMAAPDIMPTLLAMCGLVAPTTSEGVNLLNVFDGDAEAHTDRAVLIASYHPFADWCTRRCGRPYRGVRTERYTYVCDKNGPWLLFDNKHDPYQLDNRVNRKAMEEVQTQQENALNAILDQQNDNFQTPRQLRETWGYDVDDSESIPF